MSTKQYGDETLLNLKETCPSTANFAWLSIIGECKQTSPLSVISFWFSGFQPPKLGPLLYS